jgi:photosystem I subunit 8
LNKEPLPKGEKLMATFLPSIFVPLVGLVFPAVTMAALFLYIEKEQVS